MAARKSLYDTERLLADADMKMVAEEIGMKIDYAASCTKNTGILCPNPEHSDRHFGNCFIRPDHTYVCYSCGDNGNVIHMVMQYLNVSYREALGVIADICGGRQYYLEEVDEQDIRFQPVLNHKECELIGICNASVFGIVGIQSYPSKAGPGERIRFTGWTEDDDAIYVVEKCLEPNPLLALMRTDYDSYCELVVAKAEEAIEENYGVIKEMSSLQDGELFIPFYCSQIEQIEELLTKHFGGEKRAQDLLLHPYAKQGQVASLSVLLAPKPLAAPF